MLFALKGEKELAQDCFQRVRAYLYDVIFFFIRFVLEKRMREPALILNGIIIQCRVQNTEAGFQIKQAPGQLVNFRYKFINFLSLSPLEPPPPKKNIKHKKQ